MRVHEKDTELKIPNWYLKLPQSIINRISDICFTLSRLSIRKKKRNNTNSSVKFFL